MVVDREDVADARAIGELVSVFVGGAGVDIDRDDAQALLLVLLPFARPNGKGDGGD